MRHDAVFGISASSVRCLDRSPKAHARTREPRAFADSVVRLRAEPAARLAGDLPSGVHPVERWSAAGRYRLPGRT
jgi:hypothetical protein